jgi:hypothetical protein
VAESCAADFNIDMLRELIRTPGVRTIEETLALLPTDLRANYTLVFASRSLQAATFSAPRAILYGVDGRFIVSFNGDANERGYDVLETMQFDERSNRELRNPRTTRRAAQPATGDRRARSGTHLQAGRVSTASAITPDSRRRSPTACRGF